MKRETLTQNRYSEKNARKLLYSLLDKNTFKEILDPRKHLTSPHLEMIGKPVEFDDGVVTGIGKLKKQTIFIAAQQGAFSGGTIGEIHGAKLVGLLEEQLLNALLQS